MTGAKGREQGPDLPPVDDSIGQRAVEVGLITANQLRDVLLELSRTGGEANIATVLIGKGLLSAAQVDALSGAPLKRLGKYNIVRELGRGGMGVVYEAEDSELDRRVALKMLLGSLHSDPHESALEEERFIREARLSANLPKHPQIIGVYEAGILDGRRFIAMEYIEGRQFQDWRRQGSITLRQQITVLRDAAMAVEHAHRHGIIHRDLKPANILVDRKNHPHVADFGLAKRTNQNATLSITASGMVMGTPAYMSPEQAHGGKDVDLRTDLWALGVMLYEILTGRVPFDGDSPVKILMKTVNEPVPPPSTILRGPSAALDAAIEAIVMKALTKDPRHRYPSARAFADDLGRWLRGEGVSVLAKTPASSAKTWIAVGAAAALAAAGIAWFALSPSAEEEAAERARGYVAQGQRLMKQEKYSDALVKFGQALSEDRSNRDAVAGKKQAEERMVAAARPAPPDPARVRESIQKELLELETAVAAFGATESYNSARELLTSAARRRAEEEWSTAISSRLEALRRTVDQSFGAAKARAVEAKKAGDAAAVEAARTRVKNWKWAGLAEELDLELARTKEAPPAPPPPPATPAAGEPTALNLREIASLRGSENAISALAFSSDGRTIATVSFDQSVRVWDVPGRSEKFRMPERFAGRSVAISPDGRWVAGGSMDGTLRLWQVPRYDPRTFTSGSDRQIVGLAFSADSKTLYSSGVDGFLRTWDVETGLPRREMKGHPRGALQLSLSPDGKFAAVGTGEPLVKVWDLKTGQEKSHFQFGGTNGVLCVAYAPDGKGIAFSGEDGVLRIGDPSTGAVRELGAHPGPVRALAWSPDGRWIATGAAENRLRLWDPKTGRASSIALENGAFSVGFSPKGDVLAAGAADWTLKLWELPKQ